MVIPTYFQLRTTVNLMSQQSTQSQPTQAVYFFCLFLFCLLSFFHHIKGMPKTSWKYSLNAENICIFNVSM